MRKGERKSGMNFKIPEKYKNILSKLFTKDKLLLFLLFGVLLIVICIPTKSSGKKTSSQTEAGTLATSDYMDYTRSLEERLENTLSKIEGAGETRVMIYLKNNGKSVLYTQKELVENRVSETDSAGGVRDSYESSLKESVVYTENNGAKVPFVTEEEAPKVQGVIIIAKGADDARIVSEITEAASALLGITVNKIKVLKMEV